MRRFKNVNNNTYIYIVYISTMAAFPVTFKRKLHQSWYQATDSKRKGSKFFSESPYQF